MSVLIKGMEMPNKKNGAVLIIYPNGDAVFEDGYHYKAIPVPPHGRLIDADALDIKRREEQAWIDYNVDHHNEYLEGVKDGLHEAAKQLSLAPTIIPADLAEEGE